MHHHLLGGEEGEMKCECGKELTEEEERVNEMVASSVSGKKPTMCEKCWNDYCEIKFRAWDKQQKRMFDWKEVKLFSFDEVFSDDNCIPLQFTGLKDKNGVEIYEGDIVQFNLTHFGTVEWFNSSWVLKNTSTKEYEGQFLHGIVEYYGKRDLEVIGNIYDNPELIGEKR
jgi:hypothetical protein